MPVCLQPGCLEAILMRSVCAAPLTLLAPRHVPCLILKATRQSLIDDLVFSGCRFYTIITTVKNVAHICVRALPSCHTCHYITVSRTRTKATRAQRHIPLQLEWCAELVLPTDLPKNRRYGGMIMIDLVGKNLAERERESSRSRRWRKYKCGGVTCPRRRAAARWGLFQFEK